LISFIVNISDEKKEMEVVAMGTGSKCIGKSKLCPQGDACFESFC